MAERAHRQLGFGGDLTDGSPIQAVAEDHPAHGCHDVLTALLGIDGSRHVFFLAHPC
ncbi:hypothetical protein GCM10010439_04920 [Actinocorallia aurantiaca]|uniref:Uncharacterized protein n=1 Tax=Actinocorallia aurantiaca TaxID=46204 RepID=A0ABP6GCS9_9ACTN